MHCSWRFSQKVAASLAVGLALACGACNGPNIVGECPSGARTGAAPTCILVAECSSTHAGVELDCSANDGNCVCSENGVIGLTVPYQDNFCTAGGPDYTSLEPALDSANDACKWNL